jgi:gas vesicle protein
MSDRDEYATIVIEREGGVGTFFIGALIGAAAALLFAPRSGEETRTELRAGMNRLRDRAEDGIRELQNNVTGRYEDVRSDVSGRVHAARDAFESGRRAATDRARETGAGVRAGYDAARRPADNDSGGVGEAEL